MLEQEPSHGDKIKLICIHESLFVASHLYHAIFDRGYAGVRNMMVEITKIGPERCVLRRISFQCDDSGHQLPWRERRTRYAQKFVCERDRYGPGVMVWAGIMHNGRTPFHIFVRGSVTSQWYFREIILDHVRIFRGAWSADSPNLNPTEHAWDALNKRVAQRTIPYRARAQNCLEKGVGRYSPRTSR
ncbi:transposable element Tcb2 transposase [Trichonephila clavipes]|nr:transposable element Tcb2 transposase [Trichonephila clavipes]